MLRLLFVSLMIVSVLAPPSLGQELQWTWQPLDDPIPPPGDDPIPPPNGDPFPGPDPLPFIRVTIWLCGVRNMHDFMINLDLGSTIVPVSEATFHPPFDHPDHLRFSNLLSAAPADRVISWSRFLGPAVIGPSATTWCATPVASFTVLNSNGTEATSTLAINGDPLRTFFTHQGGMVNLTTANLVTGENTRTDQCFCLFVVLRTSGQPLFIPSRAPSVVPLTILGDENMDVNEIDPSSLQLGALNVFRIGRTKEPAVWVVDRNHDQTDDLFLLFRNVPEAFLPDETEGVLTGRLLDSTLIEGRTPIRVK